MSAIQRAIRQRIRELLGPDLRSDINRLLLYGPRNRLMDVQRNAVLGSVGRGFSGSTITPEAPLIPGAFFGIPYSDSASRGWGEPLLPPPGTPGGEHPQRIWRTDGGTWALENQLDWESALPLGWLSGNVSWTGSDDITISWNWQPSGGSDLANAPKYHMQFFHFIRWASQRQAADDTIQSQIYCNGRLVAELPAFLSDRKAAVIGAAILGNYLLAVGLDVYAYSQADTNPANNKTAFGYWEIQAHADGGVELAPGASFQIVHTMEEYRWLQIWAWADNGLASASLSDTDHTIFESKRRIHRGAWTLGPEPSVNLTEEDEMYFREEFKLMGSASEENTCAVNQIPDTFQESWQCGEEIWRQPTLFEPSIPGTLANYEVSGSQYAESEVGGLHRTQRLSERPEDHRHFVAIDFQGNQEKLAEIVFRSNSILDSYLVGDYSASIVWAAQTTITSKEGLELPYREPDPESVEGQRTSIQQRRLDASMVGTFDFSVELEVGGEVKATMASIQETYDWQWVSDPYNRTRVYGPDPAPYGFRTGAGPCVHSETGTDRTWYTIATVNTLISEDETGYPNIVACNAGPGLFNWDLLQDAMLTLISPSMDIARMLGKLLFMDVREDIYVVYQQIGDLSRYSQVPPFDPEYTVTDNAPGETDDDTLTVDAKNARIESHAGTPAEIRRQLITALPKIDDGFGGPLTEIETGFYIEDFFDITHDIGAAAKGNSVLLALNHPWMRPVEDGELRIVKLYSPDADPLTLVPASGENQYIGYICRVG